MGLTRPRAYQIYDIDYKQSVRVISTTPVTLSGGAPSQVDGVSLSVNDRVLVTGQSTGSENGIYYVTTLGSGANGTWTRTVDANQTGEIEAGMIIMVTEGAVYADTSWKLITNDPIVIGTTALTFELNTGVAFGNIVANGTAVTSNSASGTLSLTAGDNIAITGNNTTKTVSIAVTGISLNSISNGISNVNVVSSGGNVTVGVGGTSNISVFSTSGLDVTGRMSATGNVLGNYIIGNGSLLTGLPAVYANANVATFLADFGSNTISTTGNITAGYFLGNGSQLTGISATATQIINGNSNVSINSANANVTVTVAGGDANSSVFSPGSLFTGLVAAPKTLTGNVIMAANSFGAIINGTVITGNLQIPDGSTVYVWTPS